MTWAKVDDRFPRHPKGAAAGPIGRDLYICGLCYCNEHLTDGFIPEAAVTTLAPGQKAPMRTAQSLVSIGLWELCPGGYRVHDYHDHNPTAAQIKAERAANRARLSTWRKNKNGRTNTVTDGVRNAVSNGVRNGASNAVVSDGNPTPTPTPTNQHPPQTPPRRRRRRESVPEPPEFARFWTAYPRRDAKQEAVAAWVGIGPDESTIGRILGAIQRQCRPRGPLTGERKYIPLPSSWLNGRRWEDESGHDDTPEDEYALFPRR